MASVVAPETDRAHDDPTARRLLQQAQGLFQKWPEGFAGFRAEVTCGSRSRQLRGEVVVRSERDVQIDLADASMRAAVGSFCARVACERTPCFFSERDGRHPVAFAPRDGQPGERIIVRCPPRPVTYRVDAIGRVREVERRSDDITTLIVFLDFTRATPGRVLPVRVTVSSWNAITGAVLGYEAATRRDVRVDHVWLPATCDMDVQGPADSDTLAIAFSRHRLL